MTTRPDSTRQDDLRADDFVRGLVQAHRCDLERYVRRILPGDPWHAEDVVQETFLRAWRHADRLADVSAARPWLFRVARNVAFDGKRRQAARPVEVTEDVGYVADTRVTDRFDNVLLRRILVDALGTLSAPHRATLVHLHCHDLTQADTARMLDVPTGTVKSRHHFAVTELRQALSSRGVTGR